MNSLIIRRFLELQKWRNLRVSVKLGRNGSAFFNSFSSASDAEVSPRNGRKGKNFKASCLVDSLGLASNLTKSVSREVSFTDKANPDSVLKLFRSYGFADSQISNIIRTYPRLLIADSEKSLGLKLQFLQSRGASSSEFTEIVSSLPKILGKRGDKTLSRYYDFVKEIIEVDKKSSKYEKLCQSLPQDKKENNKIRNILVLRELGVPPKRLLPLLISKSTPVFGTEKFDASLKKVVEMGFDPTTLIFVLALRMLYQMSDKTIEEKIEVYTSVGFTVDDVWEMFKKWPLSLTHSEKKVANSVETFIGLGFSRDDLVRMVKRFPQCLGYSAESVKKKTEFVVKKMNWPLKDLVSGPQVLGYSLEKRTVPRCNVIKALMLKGLLRDGGNEFPPMMSVLVITDKAFLNRFVMKHDDKQLVPWLMAIFTGDRVSLVDQKARLEQ